MKVQRSEFDKSHSFSAHQELMQTILKSDEPDAVAVQSVTIRLPLELATSISALVEYSGKTRNKIVNQLLFAAMERVWEELPTLENAALTDIRLNHVKTFCATSEEQK